MKPAKIKNRNKYHLLDQFISYVNNLEESTVYKQNLIKDVYSFIKWKKSNIISKNDLEKYSKYLNTNKVDKTHRKYLVNSISKFFYYSGFYVQIKNNKSRNPLKIFRIFIIVLLIITFIVSIYLSFL